MEMLLIITVLLQTPISSKALKLLLQGYPWLLRDYVTLQYLEWFRSHATKSPSSVHILFAFLETLFGLRYSLGPCTQIKKNISGYSTRYQRNLLLTRGHIQFLYNSIFHTDSNLRNLLPPTVFVLNSHPFPS